MTYDKLFSVEKKLVLITGSSRGIGFTLANVFASLGATVVLNGRTGTALDKASHSLNALGFRTHTSLFDVDDENAVEKKIKDIEEKLGPIEILINNAGIQRRYALESIPLDAWEEVIRTNLTGAFVVSKAVVKRMIPRKSGKIINICSLMSELGRKTTGSYAASKGGLKMLTKAMATEWAKYNIQVNGIGPGYFLTEMTQKLADDHEFDRWLKDRTPAGRWGNPDELAGAALFLAGDASSFVNGQILYVDGGLLSAI
jgi:gluconate 5-dehydrogenase